MRKLTFLRIFLLTAFLILLTGCYDSREVDDEIYVISIGLDKGTTNKVRLTIQYPTYMDDTGGSGGQQGEMGGMESPKKQGKSNIHTIECSTILEGIDMLGMAISRRVSLMHAKMVVFSEEFAREGIGSYLAPVTRYRETRTSMAVVVVRGTAEDFIKEVRTNIGGTISKAVEFMFLQARYNNYFPYVHFKDLYRNMVSSYQQPVAIYGGVNNFDNIPDQAVEEPPLVVKKGFLPGQLPRRGVAKREFTGVAVFSGDKMVGVLDSYETTYYLMLTGRFPTGAVTFEDPNAPGTAIVLDLRNGRKPRIKARIQDGKPIIDINVKLEGEIESIQSRINYEERGMLEALNQHIQQVLYDDMMKLIEKVQKEYKADIFGFGRYLAANFATIQEWEEYNWLSRFSEAQINLDLDVHIRRTGMMRKSPFIWSN